ncbi:MAG: hypothetical protein JXA79_09315 [Deltaproteobacteria bacterium]|nr:hypothetical protein [Deltaproteobacteria bacterium]
MDDWLPTSIDDLLSAHVSLVETIIYNRQDEYYRMLERSDNQADATPFIEFLLKAIRDAIEEAVFGDQISDQVIQLLKSVSEKDLSSAELMQALGLSQRPAFRKNHLDPAIKAGWIERTQPDAPSSPTQQYRLTEKGRQLLNRKR